LAPPTPGLGPSLVAVPPGRVCASRDLASSGTLGSVGHRSGGWHRRWSFRVEFDDAAAVDPEPEEGLLRLAILGEHGVPRGALEGLPEIDQRLAQLFARLRPALLEDPLEQAGRVVGVRFQEPGRAPVGGAELVDELLRGRAA